MALSFSYYSSGIDILEGSLFSLQSENLLYGELASMTLSDSRGYSSS